MGGRKSGPQMALGQSVMGPAGWMFGAACPAMPSPLPQPSGQQW